MGKITTSVKHHCNSCFNEWYGNIGDPEPAECPRCKEDNASGYNDIMNGIHDVLHEHFSMIERYVAESMDGLMDQLRDEVRRNLRGRPHK